MNLGDAPVPDFVRPYAECAIRKLGYIRADRIDLFISIVIRLWRTDPRDYYWRREAETLSAEELTVLGLEKWARTPRALIDTLTTKGLENPETSFEASFRYVLNTARRNMQKQRDVRVLYRPDGSRSPLWAGVKFMAAPQRPCASALELNGALLEEHPDLPLLECDREVCACSWRMVTAREVTKG